MARVNLLGALGGAALAMCCAQPPGALANDSSAELSVGGLTFTHNADVSMESEDLTITPETVNVRYRLINNSTAPVTLTVAFPLPDIDLSDPDSNLAIPSADSVNFVDFKTMIDGAPAKFDIHQRGFLGDKDVTESIRRAGLPVLLTGSPMSRIKNLPAPTKDRLVEQGLLVPAGTDEQGSPRYDAGWTVKTSIIRQQTFPPGKPVTVEHQYRTSVGISFDSVLRKAVREQATMAAQVKRYRADYCISDFFLRGLDRRTGAQAENVAGMQERRISYILKTGANWAGPIKNFRLVVDKGRADRLVSFCGENVKRLTPTTFEMVAKDFVPQRDLKILLIGPLN